MRLARIPCQSSRCLLNCAYPRTKTSSAKPESKNASPQAAAAVKIAVPWIAALREPHAMQGENGKHCTAGREQAYQ